MIVTELIYFRMFPLFTQGKRVRYRYFRCKKNAMSLLQKINIKISRNSFWVKNAAKSPGFLKKKNDFRFVDKKMTIFAHILNEILSARQIKTDRNQIHGTAINQIVVLLTLRRSTCSIILFNFLENRIPLK